MTRILLTGRNGQVGWELERSLALLGDVLAFDHAGLDLANPDRIREVIRQAKPDIIVNAAAYTAVDRAESEPDLAMAINGTAPGVMAEEAKRLGALLVHYSTDYVFDGTKQGPYTEDDAPNPINAYGRSKLAGEQAIQAIGSRHMILRTSWVYGLRGHNFLRTILRAARDKAEIRIVDDQVGAPTWSVMLAKATVSMLACSNVGGLYHLSARGMVSWFGFATAIFTHAQHVRRPRLVAVSTTEQRALAFRPNNSCLACDRVASHFNIVMSDWETGLRYCLAGSN